MRRSPSKSRATARALRLPHAGGMLSFMSEVTRILSAIEQGDPSAAEQLLPLVYDELRKLAATRLAQEKAGQTLQATALVHEAYLRLVDGDRAQHWNSRGHFFGAAAEAMRRILVDTARRKQRLKHGGQRQRVDLDDAVPVADDRADELLSLHAALEKLEAESTEKAQLVKLRYFAGLSHQEAAEAMGISRTTADRHWAYAKVFLRCEMDDADKS
jgi:RNA polymerase sigma factor (TIGR02999 family)